ncbi:MAG: hypothetical protein GF411_00595 [Candidatus Lokiarchaeota archaeon]|nr:hypothetical protein [Candidatus Lokiarchaeota archaeon]
MKLIYKNYEPEKGLEEKQAELYTELSGRTATADQIRTRNTQKAPEMTRYVLTEDNEALAYVTARRSRSNPRRVYIGYPWARPTCPEDAQLKIFNELMDYLKKEYSSLEIATSIVLEETNNEEQFKFFGTQNFEEFEIYGYHTYEMSIDEIEKWDLPEKSIKLDARKIAEKDIDTIAELIMNDPYISRAFPNKEAISSYLKDRIIPDDHSVIITDNDEIVAASAVIVLKPDHPASSSEYDIVIPRFTVVKERNQHAAKRMIFELAKIQREAGWEDIPLHFSFFFLSPHFALSHYPFVFPDINVLEVVMVFNKEE